MKRLLTAFVLCMFTAAMVGCEASARVDDDDDDVSYRKTTTVKETDGDTRTRTEIRADD